MKVTKAQTATVLLLLLSVAQSTEQKVEPTSDESLAKVRVQSDWKANEEMRSSQRQNEVTLGDQLPIHKWSKFIPEYYYTFYLITFIFMLPALL